MTGILMFKMHLEISGVLYIFCLCKVGVSYKTVSVNICVGQFCLSEPFCVSLAFVPIRVMLTLYIPEM